MEIFGEFDVLVIGAGPAGISAAVSSARTGAKTAIVERYGYAGGQATGGLVILLVGLTDGKQRIIKGLCEETIQRLETINSTKNIGKHVLFNPESLKYVFDLYLEENQIQPYYHSYLSDVISENDEVKGVIISGKSGNKLLKAKVYIDATGDADIANYCNIALIKPDKTQLMPITLGFRVGGIDSKKVQKFTTEKNAEYLELINNLGISTNIGGWINTLNPNEAWFNISHVSNIDGTDIEDLTKAEMLGRKQIFNIIKSFKQNVNGFENGYLIDTASQIGVRDTRRISGVHCFSKDDISKDFDDTIAKAPNYTGNGSGSVSVPYRCLISNQFKNVIFAGRSISVEHELLNMFREIPCCMATGQAAGVAAALFATDSHNINIKNIDINTLRKTLLNQNVFL